MGQQICFNLYDYGVGLAFVVYFTVAFATGRFRRPFFVLCGFLLVWGMLNGAYPEGHILNLHPDPAAPDAAAPGDGDSGAGS